MTPHKQACLFALATALLWSTIATAFKITLGYLDPWQLVFWSVLTSTLFLGVVVVAQGKLPALMHQAKESFWLYLLLGLLNPFLYHVVLFSGYEQLPAQQAQALNYSWPLALGLLAVPLLGNRISKSDATCCLVAYSGVLVISTRGDVGGLNFDNPLGVVLILSSTVIWALYWLINTKLKGDSLASLLLCFMFGLPWVVISTFTVSNPWPIPTEGLLGAVYIGLVEMGVAYVLWLKALKLTNNTTVISNISYLSPFLSLFFIAYILGENIHSSTYIGLVLIMASIIAQQRMKASQ